MKELARTAGGCAMNTIRAGNYYLEKSNQKNKTLTLGAVGQDNSAEMIIEMLNKEGICYSIH